MAHGVPPVPPPIPLAPEDRALEHWEGDRAIVGSDGACSDGAYDLLARAGFARFFATGHTRNFHAALPGPTQTAQRAEVAAIRHLLCRVIWAPTLVFTDSAFVIKGLDHLKGGGDPDHLAHSDLWEDIARALAAHPRGYLQARWVPSHTEDEDVQAGRITLLEQYYNRGADAGARAGAALHALPPGMRKEVLEQASLAKVFHAMVANILEDRATARPAQGREAGFTPEERARWSPFPQLDRREHDDPLGEMSDESVGERLQAWDSDDDPID